MLAGQEIAERSSLKKSDLKKRKPKSNAAAAGPAIASQDLQLKKTGKNRSDANGKADTMKREDKVDINGLEIDEQRRRKMRKMASEAEQHQSQLAALKDSDPEFYKYLLETDKELLEFQTGDSEDDELEARCLPSISWRLQSLSTIPIAMT